MLCPNCKTEYRPGFTRCADCDVDLVEVLPGAIVAPGEAYNNDETLDDPFCEFWKGEDQRVRGELCDVLKEAGIPYRTVQWQDHLFNSFRFPVFRVAVPFSMFPRAEAAVAAAYGSAEEADDVMNPTEENRPEFRKLLATPLEEKLQGRPEDEAPSFWDQVTSSEEDQEKQDGGPRKVSSRKTIGGAE
jgi:hypothetical protein